MMTKMIFSLCFGLLFFCVACGGAPSAPSDIDKDGIPDKMDKCPKDAEDDDGFQDDDGCPDPDNDQDGIADAKDECPIAPGSPENDGCPEYIRIEEGALVTLQGIRFKTGEAELLPESEKVLSEVVAVLKVNPQLGRLRIEGHADDRGEVPFNLELSEKRAKSVQDWLVGRGVETERLDVRGYGESQPIQDNTTPEGRFANRRVEFRILSR
ncbi:MAG: OmpA family protein [Myxococcales bacterium]|nr:MAG: OmpA family protein [Myxococcales bacterium]